MQLPLKECQKIILHNPLWTIVLLTLQLPLLLCWPSGLASQNACVPVWDELMLRLERTNAKTDCSFSTGDNWVVRQGTGTTRGVSREGRSLMSHD